ncbi:V-type ATP synthase subunit E family protein [Paludicola sp. MB14-C6]|uniref:V-type ATP synthase subunit E n=1 Tax=Paludihabitans sp. MB14-C6 TaxID=3070656 RepID=UPI0027DAB59C|nr:V-type ATP synthase subunit E family protein [Paludicola sp. MB14-C6]WMJ22609.1 V-type ATP synthase subunit E family protein [Paludicola sp. MB14-C6]
MANEEYKLAKFQAAVFAEIDAKAAQLEREAEELKEQELEKTKDEQLTKSFYLIQQKTEEIKKEYKHEVAKYSLEQKHAVLMKRNELTNNIFANVKQQIVDYTNTSEYKEYLLSSISHFAKDASYENLDIMVTSKDLAFADEIKKAFGKDCNVKESKTIELGGFIACNTEQGIYFDETLEQKLAEQKKYFIEHSQLDI